MIHIFKNIYIHICAVQKTKLRGNETNAVSGGFIYYNIGKNLIKFILHFIPKLSNQIRRLFRALTTILQKSIFAECQCNQNLFQSIKPNLL